MLALARVRLFVEVSEFQFLSRKEPGLTVLPHPTALSCLLKATFLWEMWLPVSQGLI